MTVPTPRPKPEPLTIWQCDACPLSSLTPAPEEETTVLAAEHDRTHHGGSPFAVVVPAPRPAVRR